MINKSITLNYRYVWFILFVSIADLISTLVGLKIFNGNERNIIIQDVIMSPIIWVGKLLIPTMGGCMVAYMLATNEKKPKCYEVVHFKLFIWIFYYTIVSVIGLIVIWNLIQIMKVVIA